MARPCEAHRFDFSVEAESARGNGQYRAEMFVLVHLQPTLSKRKRRAIGC